MIRRLIILLLIVGCEQTVEPLTIHGCLDSQACNYDSDATINNNSCEYETDCSDVCGGEDTSCLGCDGVKNSGLVFDECGICDSDISNDGVELWGECYNIETTTSLGLWEQGLTGEIPPEIGNLTNLTILYLWTNELTGEIPSEIGELINLTDLNLTVNQLTGEIPPEIGNLVNLTYLYLGRNQLSGEIPPEIGNLTNLSWLGLQDNQLTGEIPQAVCDLMESNNIDMDWILNGNNLINTCD